MDSYSVTDEIERTIIQIGGIDTINKKRAQLGWWTTTYEAATKGYQSIQVINN